MFRRILLWFGGMLLFSFVAYFVTWFWWSPGAQDRDEFFRSMFDLEASEAAHAYETGGPAELRRYLANLDAHFHARHYLTDPAGRDLVDGTDRSALVKAPSPRHSLLPPHGPPVLRHPIAGGRFVFIGEVQPRGSFWKDISVYAWIVLVIVLLCYVLAWRLARPIQALRETVVRFGQGELAVRSGSTRKDEIGELARAFDQMAGRIQTLLTAERRLLQDISHELRSPLARLRFAVELARSSPDSPNAFARIIKEVDRLAALVNELLQVTRAEGDSGSRNNTLIDVTEFLSSLADDCRIEAEARGCNLEVNLEPGVSWTGDKELLHRAVENVLRNAIRHTDPASSVELQMHREPKWIVISVRDHGPGVPDQDLATIFKPFYRVEADRSRESGGVGLGLAIADRAVRVHQGQIEARNMQPGLLIEMRLPR